ncbi:MAG: prepilin peptidase [Candidatus Doudnabacteria bacterium]|nr:prepilin peptidase [Candidatus Doudnabacteria bacterium]
MVIVIVIVSGLIIGSFLNAAIFRLHSGQSILFDRSKCPNCKHVLGIWDLVPVLSFLFLKGRCRYCRSKISWQYPIIELATALVFVLLFWNMEYGIWNMELWFQAIFACFFILIAVYDYKHYLILDKVLVLLFAISLGYNIYQGKLAEGLLMGAGFAAFFLLQYFLSSGRWIGMGDIKFGFVLGNMFGYLSLIVLLLAYLGGALLGLILIAAGRKALSSRLPFGTFLSASAIMTLLYGDKILAWYLDLIGM